MRSLFRNQRQIHYAVPLRTEPILDEYGHDSLEVRTVYSSPALLRLNISANVGEDAVQIFGRQTEYSRTASFTGAHCPLVEGTKVWFGRDPAEPHNYTVVKVADSKNIHLIALREVSPRA